MYIIIIGCGRMGSDLAHILSDEGHNVVLIDQKPESFQKLGPSFNGMTITGNGFDCDVLENAGIKEADALAAVTDDDNTNIIAVQIARQIYNVPNAMARVYDPKKAATYNQLGLEIVNTTTVIARIFRDRFVYRRIEKQLSAHKDLIELYTIEVKEGLIGKKVADINSPGLFCVMTINIRGYMTLPLPDYALAEGDLIMGVGLVERREEIHTLLWGIAGR